MTGLPIDLYKTFDRIMTKYGAERGAEIILDWYAKTDSIDYIQSWRNSFADLRTGLKFGLNTEVYKLYTNNRAQRGIYTITPVLDYIADPKQVVLTDAKAMAVVERSPRAFAKDVTTFFNKQPIHALGFHYAEYDETETIGWDDDEYEITLMFALHNDMIVNVMTNETKTMSQMQADYAHASQYNVSDDEIMREALTRGF